MCHYVTVGFFPSSCVETAAQNRIVKVNMKCGCFIFFLKLWLKSFEPIYISHEGHRNQGFNQEVAWQ